MTTTIAIVGSRHWTDYRMFCAILSSIANVQEATTIISGGAYGVDHMAEQYAKETGKTFRKHLPDTRTHRSFTLAAHARNQRIADDLAECRKVGDATFLIAMPGPRAKGTWDTVRRVQGHGIAVIIREVPE